MIKITKSNNFYGYGNDKKDEHSIDPFLTWAMYVLISFLAQNRIHTYALDRCCTGSVANIDNAFLKDTFSVLENLLHSFSDVLGHHE